MTSRSDAVGVDTVYAEKILKRLIASVWSFKRPENEGEYTELVESWRDAINFAPSSYPRAIYMEAATSWLSEATSASKPPMPGDILHHCAKVMDRIDRDPVRGPKMRAWVEQRRMARIDAMAGDGDE